MSHPSNRDVDLLGQKVDCVEGSDNDMTLLRVRLEHYGFDVSQSLLYMTLPYRVVICSLSVCVGLVNSFFNRINRKLI